MFIVWQAKLLIVIPAKNVVPNLVHNITIISNEHIRESLLFCSEKRKRCPKLLPFVIMTKHTETSLFHLNLKAGMMVSNTFPNSLLNSAVMELHLPSEGNKRFRGEHSEEDAKCTELKSVKLNPLV